MSQTYNSQCRWAASLYCSGRRYPLSTLRAFGEMGFKRGDMPTARRNLARHLRQLGYSLPEIGSALCLDHSAILLMLRKPEAVA